MMNDWTEHAPSIVIILISACGLMAYFIKLLLTSDIKGLLTEVQAMRVRQVRADLMLHKMCIALQINDCDEFIRKQEGC